MFSLKVSLSEKCPNHFKLCYSHCDDCHIMRNNFMFSLKVSLSEKCPNHSIKDHMIIIHEKKMIR